jgi:hypothetical protein
LCDLNGSLDALFGGVDASAELVGKRTAFQQVKGIAGPYVLNTCEGLDALESGS